MNSRPVWALTVLFLFLAPLAAAQTISCTASNTVWAEVAALDQPYMFNRIGAAEPQGMIFALLRDVIPNNGTTGPLVPGQVMVRPDKRPRPIVLRVNQGQCLRVVLTNLLNPTPPSPNSRLQPVTRQAGIHLAGMELATSIDDDSTWAGKNANALINANTTAPAPKTYTYLAAAEGVFHIFGSGTKIGTGNGQPTEGMFGAVIVEPQGAEYYRAQTTNDDLIRWAARRTTANQIDVSPLGQPLINYASVYPPGHPRQCTPVLRMVDVEREVIGNQTCGVRANGRLMTYHADLYGIITGPGAGRFTGTSPSFDPIPSSPDRRQPFREFIVAYHESSDTIQAFPDYYTPPTGQIGMNNTLKSAKDQFAINYGSGGIGAEILANRLGVGPMWDCIDCKFEEFFLTSWAVGDPAMVVDVPANANTTTPNTPNTTSALTTALENCQVNGSTPCVITPGTIPGRKATKAFYPDDPSNVLHSYMNDHVKFRILHAAGTLTHVHHQHAHQWLHSPNNPDSTYLDSQMLSPSAGFTLEISYGGSGNRNKTPGDSIFHCHFYPHFAQGMWAMWRVHDTYEMGTKLDGNGRPVRGARAYPDAEILTGTPIPAVIPLPTLGMPLLPGYAWIENGNIRIGGTCSNNAVNGIPVNGGCINGAYLYGYVDGNNRFLPIPTMANAGFPFYIPGVAGKRPPHPPLDFACELQPDNVTCKRDGLGNILYLDGGLPRHVITGGSIAPNRERHNQWDFTKDNDTLQALQLPEDGTQAEKAAIAFYRNRTYNSFTATSAAPATFTTNGLPRGPQNGAPFADPAVDDNGAPVGTMIRYKGANIQRDVVFNKKGWHNPQQRFITLWDDITPTLNNQRLIQPFFFRANSREQFVEYWHTNLVPNYYELDDYQVRTPTDILGQHIHLVKFDVLASDGAANGWNYEDGTFAAQEVRERICAINAVGGIIGLDGRRKTLTLKNIPQLGAGPDPSTNNCHTDGGKDPALDWRGAQATIQRWWPDPLLGTPSTGDRTIRTVFTHDHYGPSTHQQAGLYAGLLVEPEGSRWTMPDGTAMGGRHDGGPTSWEARILKPDGTAYREFALEFGDVAQAYQPDSRKVMIPYTGTPANGIATTTPVFGWADCLKSINNSSAGGPACQQSGQTGFTGLAAQPTVISVGPQQGAMNVNYRSEPVPFRIAGTTGTKQTDLGFAFASMTRNDAALNVQPTAGTPISTGSPFTFNIPYAGAAGTDPYTPLIRAYQGDDVQIRVLVGAHLTNHNFGIHGVNWQFEPSAANSGFRDNQGMGISEHFEFLFQAPYTSAATTTNPCPYGSGTRNIACADYLYSPGSGQIDFGQGLWGLMRTYNTGNDRTKLIPDLAALPTNSSGGIFPQGPTSCPDGAPVQTYWVSAESPSTAVTYNGRTTTAITMANPLQFVLMTANFAGKLFPSDKPEPAVLRARPGECVVVNFRNNFNGSAAAFTTVDSGAPNTQPWKSYNSSGSLVPTASYVPSKYAGLHPQMLSYDVTQSAGLAVGINPQFSVVGLNGTYRYEWYAGRMRRDPNTNRMVGTPIEFGASNLLPADFIEQTVNAMVGQVIIEPAGSTWRRNTSSNLNVDIFDGAGNLLFREFVAAIQDRISLVQGTSPFSAKAVNYSTEPMTYRYGSSISNQSPATGLAQAYSNSLPVPTTSTPWHDPQTTRFCAFAGDRVRFRVTHPAGLGGFPDNVFTIHGHVWQEEPFTSNSSALGFNRQSEWIGSRDGVGPQHHFDALIDSAGGVNRITGDYIYEDYPSTSNGVWGVFRVVDNPAEFTQCLALTLPQALAVPRREAATVPPIQNPDFDHFLSDRAIELQKRQTEDQNDESEENPPANPPNQ